MRRSWNGAYTTVGDTIHADGHCLALEHTREDLTGELRTLSLLNTSGLPCSRMASSRQSTQNTASMVLLIRQLKTRREYQSMMATR
jgi:hypothetical protein